MGTCCESKMPSNCGSPCREKQSGSKEKTDEALVETSPTRCCGGCPSGSVNLMITIRTCRVTGRQHQMFSGLVLNRCRSRSPQSTCPRRYGQTFAARFKRMGPSDASEWPLHARATTKWSTWLFRRCIQSQSPCLTELSAKV